VEVYNSEEEQVQAIKQWWKDNYFSIIAGIVIGIVVLGGYKFWSEKNTSQSQQASVVYSELLLTTGDRSRSVETLKNDYSSTPYAALSALLLAKDYVLLNKLDDAALQLSWVIENASDDGVEHIARQRLARLYLSQDKISEAESLINGIKVPAYTASYSEIRGDILLAKKLPAQAKENYRTALSALKRGDRRREIIKMKLDDLTQENKAK